MKKRALYRRSRPRIGSLRRAAAGVAVAVVGLAGAASPAFAAPGTDGTSNTIQLAVKSAVLDQAHHRVVVTAPGAGGLVTYYAPGPAPCMPGVGACLMEPDGLYL